MDNSTSSYDDNVFINCPFDKQYKPIFNALVFAIHDAGFVARCSLEAIDAGRNRLAKIVSIIAECKYGIHDISRTQTSGQMRLPRFNMPFECGLFWGCLEYGERRDESKRILVLDSEAHRYRATLSDIAGQDIQVHRNKPSVAINKVRIWLSVGAGHRIPGGKDIWDRYVLFQKALTPMLRRARITRAEIESPEYYPDYLTFIVEWLTEQEAQAAEKE